jgi:hypothetical protein
MARTDWSDSNMQTVPFSDEEIPTTPTVHTPSRLLAFATRVDRIVADALDCIRRGDPQDAASALVQLQALTGSVLR